MTRQDNPLDIICLRLLSTESKSASYYRDGGQWDATVRIIDEKMECEIDYTGAKNEAIECTYEVWKKNNGQYSEGITEDGEDSTSNNFELPF